MEGGDKMETTIGERIAMVRKSQGYTLEKFGEAIGIKKGSVSLLERGINTPADRTIFMICNRFSVSEQWLRTGEGDMFKGLTPSEEIESFLGTLAIAGDENFKKRLILYLAQMKDSDWEKLEQVLDTLLAGKDIIFPPDTKSEK
jgi:transcriptional regulator with XRE-family HTH domain